MIEYVGFGEYRKAVFEMADNCIRKIDEVLEEVMVEVRKSRDREAVQLEMLPDEGRTKQQFANDVDMNYIIEKFKRTGINDSETAMRPAYGDFSKVLDYQDAKQSIVDADAAFGTLSAKVRRRFMNSPQELLKFVDDPENEEEARKMGLLAPLPDPPKGAPGDGKPPARKEPASGETPPEGGEGV